MANWTHAQLRERLKLIGRLAVETGLMQQASKIREPGPTSTVYKK